jgi:hypothetical protein
MEIVLFYLFFVGGIFFIAVLYSLIAGFWKKDRRKMLNAGKYVMLFIGIAFVLLWILRMITRFYDLDSDK